MGDTDEERKEEEEEEREPPLSVRDAVGPARPGSMPTPARSDPGRDRGAGASDEGSGQEESQGEARPTPVRELMGAEAGGRSVEVPLPTRSFRHRERSWVVTVVGTTITGQPPDPGAPLMHLRFHPGPSEEGAGEGPGEERELLCVGRGIDGLYEEELRELLDRSRPAKGGRERGSG